MNHPVCNPIYEEVESKRKEMIMFISLLLFETMKAKALVGQ
jgi:hypothetical protein